MRKIIPFYLPNIDVEEIQAVTTALKQGMLAGNGPVSKEVEERIAEITKSKYVFFTNSCTSALELAMMACEISYADEVICPSFSFVSVANAIVRQHAKPVFVDIDRETLNIDIELLKKAITKKTKAIVCVHYAGRPCQMDEIIDIAKKHNLMVIEDAAQAMGSYYKDRHLGTIGDIGCISFHATKSITCGEGGALLTDNKSLAEKIELMREKGTNRSLFLKGMVDKYTWVSIGSSYVQSDILAAILLAQLKKLPQIVTKQTRIASYYNDSFRRYPGIGLPKTVRGGQTNWHIYAIIVKAEKRDQLLKGLKQKGIGASFHFIPLHTSPFGRKFGYKKGDLPVTEQISNSLIRLPIYFQMRMEDVRYVVSAIKDLLEVE
jgi:dTDP-4-amino-4,6-dideoxygalactose transaminase